MTATAKGDKSSEEGVYKLPREWFDAWERLLNQAFISWIPRSAGRQELFTDPRSIYLAIDFRYLLFDLQMKVNAGGCTHRDKLDVVSKYKFYRPCILIHACICAHA